MSKSPEEIKDKIIEAMLPNVSFDGWTVQCAENAAVEAGFDADVIHAIFPDGLEGIVAHFSHWADHKTLEALEGVDIEALKIRERIHMAVLKRFEILMPYKDAVRMAMSYWTVPLRGLQGPRNVWKTANVIWNWAGDKATDYNRYTKRTLLSGVIISTTLAWQKDGSDDLSETSEFLHRRIENVLKVGKLFGKLKRA
jgi:ubiquinone biosynthesis protein COQ9